MTLDRLEKEKRTFDQLNKVVKSFNQVRKQDFWWTKILSNSNNLFPKSKQANQLNHLNWSLRFNGLLLGNVFDFFSLRNSQKTKKYTNTEVWFLKLLTHCQLHFGVVAVTQTFAAALVQKVLRRTEKPIVRDKSFVRIPFFKSKLPLLLLHSRKWLSKNHFFLDTFLLRTPTNFVRFVLDWFCLVWLC
jgi:hypothetical protein